MDRIGTAGWTIPRTSAAHFPAEGTGLERYAAVLPAAEINTTFYRSHKPAIFERWANATPPHFRFAVKAPKTVTHEKRLVETNDLLRTFIAEIAPLGGKLGPVLIQLPPSLQFTDDAAHFVGGWRELYEGPTVIEARHATWFTGEAEARLADAHIARVAADPAVVPEAARPGGWTGLTYIRLHGSPRMYASHYSSEQIATVAATLATRQPGTEGWCIFDNTMLGAAAANALELMGV
ncbi:MAG: DUF72 domain-containing protein [Phenylobacterium sp.]|nr:DUF72 domain-containing protein [Phenylobacterium sp.]